ncbi:MAG: hypothetical protein NXY59_03190 [Aigarchaeota archaeon]|nr:hypothetical protein [Candidatus Pelearchaeum maunauluense]
MDVWRAVWQSEAPSFKFEKELFSIFAQNIDEKLENDSKKLRIAYDMLHHFNKYISNRSNLLLSGDLITKVFNWHYKAWQCERQLLNNAYDTLDPRGWWGLFHDQIDEIFKQLTSHIIKNNSRASLLMAKMRQHADDKKSDENYLKHLFSLFFEELFKCAPLDYNVWVVFPNEWKITKQNLENKNLISNVAWNEYLKFARQRLGSQNAFDEALNDITLHLFPEVDPALWLILVHFKIYGEDWYAIELLIEKGWLFVSRSVSASGCSDDLDKLFELSKFLFPNISVENIKSYARRLNKIQYSDEYKETRRIRLHELFNQWASHLEK